jgi:hypothetical protein
MQKQSDDGYIYIEREGGRERKRGRQNHRAQNIEMNNGNMRNALLRNKNKRVHIQLILIAS